MRSSIPKIIIYRQHEPFVANIETNQRTIYQFRQRIRKNVYLDTFDGPDGNLPLSQRRATTTGIQSLFMMNSAFIDEHARAIADRVVLAESSNPQRIDWLYENIFGRQPTTEEIRFLNDGIDAPAMEDTRIVQRIKGDDE